MRRGPGSPLRGTTYEYFGIVTLLDDRRFRWAAYRKSKFGMKFLIDCGISGYEEAAVREVEDAKRRARESDEYGVLEL